MPQLNNHLVHQQLILCAAGDSTEANSIAFYEQYSPILYGMILRAHADEAIASMILIETFKEIFLCADQYDPKKLRVLIWMMQICQRQISRAGEPGIPKADSPKTYHGADVAAAGPVVT